MKKLTKQILKEMVLAALSNVDVLNEMTQKEAMKKWPVEIKRAAEKMFKERDYDGAKKLVFVLLTKKYWETFDPTGGVEPGEKARWKRMARKALKAIAETKRRAAQKARSAEPPWGQPRRGIELSPDAKKSTAAKAKADQTAKEKADQTAAEAFLKQNPGYRKKIKTLEKEYQKLVMSTPEDPTKLKAHQDKIDAKFNELNKLKTGVAAAKKALKKTRGTRRARLRRKYPFPSKAKFKKKGGKAFESFEEFYAEVAKNPAAVKALSRNGKLARGGRDKVWGRSHWKAWNLLTKTAAAKPAVTTVGAGRTGYRPLRLPHVQDLAISKMTEPTMATIPEKYDNNGFKSDIRRMRRGNKPQYRQMLLHFVDRVDPGKGKYGKVYNLKKSAPSWLVKLLAK